MAFGHLFAPCASDCASDAYVFYIYCEPTDSKLCYCAPHTTPTAAYLVSSARPSYSTFTPGCCCLLAGICMAP